MATAAEDSRSFLLQRIRDDLKRVQALASRLKRTNSVLLTGSLVASAATVAVAGLTAAQGPLVGQGPPAWRWTCGVAAGISAISAVLTGAHQKFTVSERLANARACLGQLRALEFAVHRGRNPDEGAQLYEEILKQYPELNA